MNGRMRLEDLMAGVMNQVLRAEGSFQEHQIQFWEHAAREAGRAFPDWLAPHVHFGLSAVTMTICVVQVQLRWWERAYLFVRRRPLPPPEFRLATPAEERDGKCITLEARRDESGRWSSAAA